MEHYSLRYSQNSHPDQDSLLNSKVKATIPLWHLRSELYAYCQKLSRDTGPSHLASGTVSVTCDASHALKWLILFKE